jgi:hypothetical protein
LDVDFVAAGFGAGFDGDARFRVFFTGPSRVLSSGKRSSGIAAVVSLGEEERP